jgi:hypothetical protein
VLPSPAEFGLPVLLTLVLGAEPISGSSWRKSPMLVAALAWSSSRVITVTGPAVSRSLRRTREPVTRISSSADLLGGAVSSAVPPPDCSSATAALATWTATAAASPTLT